MRRRDTHADGRRVLRADLTLRAYTNTKTAGTAAGGSQQCRQRNGKPVRQ